MYVCIHVRIHEFTYSTNFRILIYFKFLQLTPEQFRNWLSFSWIIGEKFFIWHSRVFPDHRDILYRRFSTYTLTRLRFFYFFAEALLKGEFALQLGYSTTSDHTAKFLVFLVEESAFCHEPLASVAAMNDRVLKSILYLINACDKNTRKYWFCVSPLRCIIRIFCNWQKITIIYYLIIWYIDII